MFIFTGRFNYSLTREAINEFAGPIPDTSVLITIQISFHFSKLVFCLVLLEAGQPFEEEEIILSQLPPCCAILFSPKCHPVLPCTFPPGDDFKCLRGACVCGRPGGGRAAG